MAPKPAAKSKGPAPPAEPVVQLPPDLPATCPFETEWHAAVFTVCGAEGVNVAAVRDAFKQLQVLQQLALSDLAARLDPADPLAAEVAAAEAARAAAGPAGADGSAASFPPTLAAKLLQQRFSRDEALAWKLELVRRREALARAEQEAKVAEVAATEAAAARAAAAARLEAFKASLPQRQQPASVPAPQPLPTAGPGSIAGDDKDDNDDADAEGFPGLGDTQQEGQPAVQADAQLEPEPELSPEQQRGLAEAEAAAAAASDKAVSAEAGLAAAGKELAAARQGMDSRFCHYEAYWVEGLGTSAAAAAAAVAAGIPLRAAAFLCHAQPAAAAAAQGSGKAEGSRPGTAMSAASVAAAAAVADAASSAGQGLPEELIKLQAAVAAAAWDSPLSGLLVLQLAIGDAASPFTTAASCRCVVDPPWAAASSAAAAAKAAASAAAAAAAAAAAEARASFQSATGNRPAGSAGGPRSATSSSGGKQPGSAAASGGAAAGPGVAAAGPGPAASSDKAPAAPEEVPGCKELARALLTVRNQARVFDRWRAGVRVYRMPAPPAAADGSSSGSGMGYYQHLLSSVAPECQSVAVVLHALLEQVSRNCIGEPREVAELEQQQKQVLAVAQAQDAIAAAFQGLLAGDEDQLLEGQHPQPAGLTLLYEGDEVAAAAHGVTTGYVHAAPAACDRPAAVCRQSDSHSSSSSSSSSGSDGGSSSPGSARAMRVGPQCFSARGLSVEDVAQVERHMLQLLRLPGLGSPEHSTSAVGRLGAAAALQKGHAGIREEELQRSLQASELQALCGDVPLATVRRCQVLEAACAMLPGGVRAAHAEQLLARRHTEQLQPDVLKQVLLKASLQYPDVACTRFEPRGGNLLAFYVGAETDRSCQRSMPHAQTFHQFWQQLLEQGCQPELQQQVYEMSAAAAQQDWRQQLLYTDAGFVITRGSEGPLALHQGDNMLRMLPEQGSGSGGSNGCTFQLVGTLEGGAVVSVAAAGAQQDTAAPGAVACPAAAAGSAAEAAGGGLAPVLEVNEGPAGSSSSSGASVPAGQEAAAAAGAGAGGDACAGAVAGTAQQGSSCLAAASAASTAVRVCTPGGLLVELSSEGRVLVAPVQPARPRGLHATGVDVLGAPLAPGQLDAQLASGPFAWHALLPDGTLVKAPASAAAQHGGSGSAAELAPGVVRLPGRGEAAHGALTILHTDGSTSLQLPGQVDVGEGSLIEAAGWLHTDGDGQLTWLLDETALDGLQAAAAAAAEQAAAAAAEVAAAAAAAEAAAAAAAETTGKKGKKTLEKQKSGSKGRPETAAGTGAAPAEPAAAAAAASGDGAPAALTRLEDTLQKLKGLAPVPRGCVRAAVLTDPDTRAVVSTREDHVMSVAYPDGSKLLQDAAGCRVSFVNGAWRFEAAGLPVVTGDALGVSVEPCPGVSMHWSAQTRAVTLSHACSGTVITSTSCGRVAAGARLSAGCQELFADLAMPQQQQQAPADSAAGADAAAAGQEPAALAGQVLPLLDIAAQEECWGMLAVDLCTGEAGIWEQAGCRLHLAPGAEVRVWANSHDSQPEAAESCDDPASSPEPSAASSATDAVAPAGITAPAAAEAGASSVAAAASEAAGAFDDELDEERAVRLAREAAAAAAAAEAAAAAAAAEAAAAAAAAEAARLAPRPVAVAVRPRLFVLDPRTGSGVELLGGEVVGSYLAAVAGLAAASSDEPQAVSHRHQVQQALGADEPGSLCHTVLTSYSHRSPELQPLTVADPSVAVPCNPDGAASLLSLRRTDVFVPAELQTALGLKLPRVAALNPSYTSAAAAGTTSSMEGAAGMGKASGMLATRVAAGSSALAGGAAQQVLSQVLVVRELLELPELTGELQQRIQGILAAWQAHREGQEALLAARLPHPDPSSPQLRRDAAEVAAMLQAAGAVPLLPDACDGCCRLEALKAQLLAEQAAAEAAAGAAATQAQERAAADAAARRKPNRPWPKREGPFDHMPQKPEPGQTLRYFEVQEGLVARQTDPLLQPGTRLTRHDLPPPKPVQPASAGVQHKPGVYLASSTSLAGACGSTTQDGSLPGASAATAAGLGGRSGSRLPGPRSKLESGLLPGGDQAQRCLSVSPQAGVSPHQRMPKQARQQLSQQQGGDAEQQADSEVAAVLCGSLGAWPAAGTAAMAASVKSHCHHAFDVYGQPRVMQPPLPAAHLKSQAPLELNAAYLTREEAVRRTTKTSSASLIRASGKAVKQLALSPAHMHFGTVAVGSVSHRTARLLNCSTDVVRFTVVRPALPLRVLHKPVPLPAGMEAALTVELVAEAPGDFVGEVTVRSEVNVLTLTVSAKVLPTEAGDEGGGGGSVGAGAPADDDAGAVSSV